MPVAAEVIRRIALSAGAPLISALQAGEVVGHDVFLALKGERTAASQSPTP